MRHLFWWRRTWSVVLAVGWGLILLMWSPVSATVAVFGLAGAAVVLYASLRPEGSALPWPPLLAWSLATGAALTVVVAVATVFPVVAWLLVLLAVGSHPVPVGLVRRAVVGSPAPLPGVEERETPLAAQVRDLPSSVTDLPAEQLCLAWRRSFVALERSRTPEERLRVVALRQQYLDELWRRDEQALRAWGESGPRAAGGPDRFLRDSR